MYQVTHVFTSAPLALSAVALYRRFRIASIQEELDRLVLEEGVVCPLTAAQLYELEVVGCVYLFNSGLVDITAINPPVSEADKT
jgi:hypothetical protein